METEILELLNQADAKLRERMEPRYPPFQFGRREEFAAIRFTIQEAINELLLLD